MPSFIKGDVIQRMTGGFLIIINKKPLSFAYAQHLPLKRGANFDKHQTKSISIFFTIDNGLNLYYIMILKWES